MHNSVRGLLTVRTADSGVRGFDIQLIRQIFGGCRPYAGGLQHL
jgi:hypothetical protein